MARRKTSDDTEARPVYAIHGGDRFLASEALRDVVNAAVGENPDAMAVAEFDGKTAELADVLDELRTPSLLVSRRVVVLRDADPFVSRYRKQLERYLESPSDTGVLVLLVRRWQSNEKLYKRVAAIGRNVKCEPPETRDLSGWIAARASEQHNCRLDPVAAARLAELVGAQTGRLDSEIEKLATFVAPRTSITVDDVETLVGASRLETVFALGDAMARRDAPAALELWNQVLETDRSAPFRSLGGLAYVFRRWIDAHRLADAGLPPPEIKARLGIPPFAPNPANQALRFSLRLLEDYLVKLLQADLAAKSGLGRTETALEKLIVQFCKAP